MRLLANEHHLDSTVYSPDSIKLCFIDQYSLDIRTLTLGNGAFWNLYHPGALTSERFYQETKLFRLMESDCIGS